MFPNIEKENVTIIKNGIDLKSFKYSAEVRTSERKALGLTDNFVIGNVGRFAYQKNHKFIIDSFALVHNKVENSKLLLIGEGELLYSMEHRHMLKICCKQWTFLCFLRSLKDYQ